MFRNSLMMMKIFLMVILKIPLLRYM